MQESKLLIINMCMKSSDQTLLEEAYQQITVHTTFLKEGFTDQMMQWCIDLFKKKFAELGTALDQAVETYRSTNNFEKASDVFAKALAAYAERKLNNEGFVKDSFKKGVNAAAPYVQSAIGLLSSPKDLVKLMNPITFIKAVRKLYQQSAIAGKNRVKRAVKGEMGIKDYALGPAGHAKAITTDVVMYNVLLHGLKRYEEKYAHEMSDEERQNLQAAKSDFSKDIRGVSDSAINPSPKQLGLHAVKGLSKVADLVNLGDTAEYYAG